MSEWENNERKEESLWKREREWKKEILRKKDLQTNKYRGGEIYIYIYIEKGWETYSESKSERERERERSNLPRSQYNPQYKVGIATLNCKNTYRK